MRVAVAWTSIVALFLLALGLGCDRKPEVVAVDPATLTWPQLSLSQVEPGLAGWLRERQAELRTEVLADPQNTKKAAKVFGELGLILDAWEQIEDAILCYRNAGQLDPSNVRWLHLEGLLHRNAGRTDEAIDRFRRVLATDPKYPATRTYLGAIEVDRGNLDEAGRIFREVLASDPKDAAAHHGLGEIALQQGRPAEAVDHFRKTLELQPQASRVRYPLAQALRDTGQADEAADLLARAGRTQVAITDPNQQLLADVRAQTALRMVGELAGKPESLTDAELLRFTLTQLSLSQGAVEALDLALARIDQAAAPRHAARLLLAIAALDIYADRDEAAVGRLRRAVELDPTMVEGWLKLGNALARRGDFGGAQLAFTNAIEADPQGDGLLARATVRLNQGDAGGALADLRQLAVARPGDGVVRVRLAEAREVSGDLQGAFTELQQAVADERLESQGRARVARGLGDFLIRRARHDQAVLAYRHALELDPTSSTVRLALGEVLGHLGRWPEAVAELERVVVEQPANELARRAEIVALVLMRDWQKVRVRLDEGLAQAPDSPVLAELGARVLAACPDAAVRDPQRALELAFLAWNAGESATRADAVAIAWGASGRFAEALEWQDRAARLGLDANEAAAHRRAFEQSEAWVARDPIALLGTPG